MKLGRKAFRRINNVHYIQNGFNGIYQIEAIKREKAFLLVKVLVLKGGEITG